MVDNPLYMPRYSPFGPLKEQAPSKIIVPNTPTGALPLIDAGFLQNGRLNDITSTWYVQPWMAELSLALGLKEPRWVSTVALYFNAYEPDSVLPHFDILATVLRDGYSAVFGQQAWGLFDPRRTVDASEWQFERFAECDVDAGFAIPAPGIEKARASHQVAGAVRNRRAVHPHQLDVVATAVREPAMLGDKVAVAYVERCAELKQANMVQ